MSKKHIWTFTIILLLFVFIIAGCSSEKIPDTSQELPTEKDVSNGQENNSINVETPYGTMNYPYGFEEIVRCETEKNGNIDQYVFYAALGEEKIKVYTITFSQQSLDNAGSLLGSVRDLSNVSAYVYFLPEDEIVNDSMTVDQKNTVYAAQETVNDVIASIKQFSTFVP